VGLTGRRRVVAAQPVDRPRRDDVERRRLLVGLEPAETRHLERVLRGGAEAAGGAGDEVVEERHRSFLRAGRSVDTCGRLYPALAAARGWGDPRTSFDRSTQYVKLIYIAPDFVNSAGRDAPQWKPPPPNQRRRSPGTTR